MDFQTNLQSESGKLENIISQFLLKILHVILDSRVPSLHSRDQSSVYRVRKSDKWFNLVLGDRPSALDNLNFWHRNVMDPMIIDIILVHKDPNPIGSLSSSCNETVIERWVVQYESTKMVHHPINETSSSYKKTYKKSIVLLRSLYTHMRLLPAYRIFRQLRSSSPNFNFDIIYKVSSFSNPFSRADEESMCEYAFVPVEALPGRLCVSVTYRSTLIDFNLEPLVSLPPKIITDYVGSPLPDPMRSFPSSEKGVRATSFPLRGVRPPSSAPLERPHSWSSGFQKGAPFLQSQPIGGSPPAFRPSPPSYDFSSSPSDNYSHRVQNFRPPAHYRSPSYDEYQLSPPFSPYACPAPSTYLFGGNPIHARKSSETAPVSIPHPIRSSRYLSPNFSDPNRHSLPPISPRSTKHDPSSQESTSANRSYRRTESVKAGELHGAVNHSSVHKMVRDNKDDSGRFSGLLYSSGSPRPGLSGSSSRLSFQDDLDDCDFSCPFDVDDIDTSDSTASQNLDAKATSELSSQSHPLGRKSQDAAVGVLVHMLRTAPPLRQDSSIYSSHSLRPEDPEGGVGTASGFFMPRKTADALEELRSYREMKDLLLSKSGTRVLSREEA
ncbi:autophagy-related protein 13a [Pistacia vera]|uniref:autophagy-related protein 13a n=1 Tax=Pistacia vera TaxID=55513 RepID=UPI0012634DBA|nr:autophagy-related protein 13a [Pistacia vera]